MKLCSRLLMHFCRNFSENDKFGYLHELHSGKLGVTHDLGWWLIGKPIIDFLFALIKLSSLSITVPELWRETCTAGLFLQGSTSLHSNFTWTGSSPLTVLGVRKLETLGYLTVETASFCVPSLWHDTRVCRTDRWTDRYAVAYTAARCKNYAES